MVSGKSTGATSSMKIKASLDTTNMDRGFTKVTQGMKRAKNNAKSMIGDLFRLKTVGAALGKTFQIAGVAASGMIAAAAMKAPALAGSMAQIGVSTQRMIRALGVGLAPVFEKLSQKLEGVADWAESHPDLFAGVLGGAATLAILGKLGVLSSIPWAAMGTFFSTVAAAAVAMAPVFALLAILAGATVAVKNIIDNLGNQFHMNDLTDVPISPEAQAQIANAGTVELGNLQDQYAGRIGGLGYGGESTPRFTETGELYNMEDAIIQTISAAYNNTQLTIGVRELTINTTDMSFN